MTVEIDFNVRSTDTHFESFLPSEKQKEALEIFENEFETSYSVDGSIESWVVGQANIVGIIFNWEAFLEDNNLCFTRDDFDQNPTEVTGASLYGDDEYTADVFSHEGGEKLFTREYVEDIGNVLGFDVKDNLDKVWMVRDETAPMVVEGDGFDVMLAPRIKPDEGWEAVHNE